MKNKIFFIIIVVLVVGIAAVQYQLAIIRHNNASVVATANNGIVKSIKNNDSHLTNDTPKLLQVPQKKAGANDPRILAKNYILMDVATAYPLVEKDAQMQVPIASTTKIMTAIITLENYKLDDVVEISRNAATQIGSDINLRTGEKLSVRSLLYALLVQSGNDAAMALAENMQGGKDAFVQKMNDKAEYLGLKNTKFKDPAGLDDSGYSSAFDLAFITALAMRNSQFKEIVKTTEIAINSVDGKFSHPLETSNRLIKPDEPLYYSLAYGVKTGYTPGAGHCLVSYANKGDNEIVGVILNTAASTNDASAKESKKLLDWGFTNFNFN